LALAAAAFAVLGSPSEFLSRRILHAANGILQLARGLLGLAIRFRFLVARGLADRLLDAADDLLERSLDPILIHDDVSIRDEVRVAYAELPIDALVRPGNSFAPNQ
jgi:hypothetical protein